jgi:lipoprotein NlpI
VIREEGRGIRNGRGAGLVALVLTAAAALHAQPAMTPRQMLDAAVDDFFAVRITESVAGFDRLAKAHPDVAAELWQRGIALYYASRYRDCQAQFESHRTVNPADVENAAWHYLCVARAESPARARAALLPVGPDARVPMREVYQMFQGTLAPDAVLKAAGGQDPRARFYALLYVGLFHEAHGDNARAREFITQAADDRFSGSVAGYMHRVAVVHARVRGWLR